MRNKRNCLAFILVITILFTNSVNIFAATTTTTAPPAPTLSYSPTTPTNGNVAVTVYYPSIAVIKQYRLGANGIWTTYSAPVVLTSNAYVYARYQDSSGSWSTLGGYPINNIDKTPPSDPTFSQSSNVPTNQNVTITISFSSDSTTKQYKIGSSSTWTNYSAPVVLASNNTVYAKASDSAGNWTSTVSSTVSNINKTAPTAPILEADTVDTTNGVVNVSISYAADGNIKQYKVSSSGTWTNYSTPIVVSSNTTIYAKAQDLAGNWSSEGSLAITNIDKTPPTLPTFTTSTTKPTNEDVTVSINFSADSYEKQYKVGSESTWTDYTAPVTLSSNDTIYSKASDIAGNWTSEASREISNIDKVPPMSPTFTASTTGATNQDVSVALTFSDDSVVRQYKIGSSDSWTNYNEPVIISSNDTIFARGCDSAGNWSEEASYAVDNIDKTPPDSPVFTASTNTPTNQVVSVSIEFSADSDVKQYKIGSDENWSDYSYPLKIDNNTVIYAKASDNAGNWAMETSYAIDNIDKVSPAPPEFTASTTELTNQDISLSISFSDDSAKRKYRIGNSGEWKDYSSPVTISSNSVIYAKACDYAGNWSEEENYVISNIDKTPPANPVIRASLTMPTNQSVTVSIDFSGDSIIKLYAIGSSGVWMDYTGSIVLDANSIVYAKASDSAGNWSSQSSYEVTNIDKDPPQAPVIKASITELTNTSVLLSIDYSLDSIIKQYNVSSSGSWTDYSVPVVINSNTTVYAKASDSAGNWSAETSYNVDNINTAAPEKPTFTVSTTKLTDSPVTVTINFSTDSTVKQYKVGAADIWMNYTSPIVLSANNTVYSKSSNTLGTWSQEASYSVANIRKTVLGYTVKTSSTDMASYNSITANTSVINEIATATYSVDAYGRLTGAAPADQINYSNSNGIKTKLMVSNNFDPNIAKQLLESVANRETLKNNILNLLKANNYKGVDIDIENIPAANRNHFTTLMSEIYSALKPLGYAVSVAVQPKTNDSPNATWNYAFDYKSLAMYSDFLMIMAYDEHYPGGTSGAIASIGWVTSVIDYTLTVVPKEKILLGMAAYGYDWAGTATKAYSLNSCYSLANQYGATINFDSTTKSKYFTYTVNGVSHTVWFEDADTIAYKLDLANSRDLKGVGIWRLGLENANYWTTIKSKLNK